MHKRRSGSRTPSFASNSRSRQQSFHRSLSFPFEGSLSSSPPRLNSHPLLTDQKENEYANELSRVQRPLLRPEGVHTDPVPALAKHLGPETISLPRAIVISGLENVSVPAQRALLKALSDKRITLEDRDGDWVWNLPEGFIVIYVCGADPRERPAIHNSLVRIFSGHRNQPTRPMFTHTLSKKLDRFAMSTSINLHASTQQAIRHMLPYHRTSLSQPAPTADSILPENLMKSLRSLAAPPPLFALKSKTNIHPTLSIYITDLFSAARHHPQLDGMLLTARARQDTEALARAVRVLGGDLTGIEFIRSVGKEMEADSKSFEDSMDGSNIDSLNTDLPQENANGFIHAVHEYSEPQETLDVSEADIARIVPRVLSHRLRVRDGPEDEILGSLEYGAVASCSDWEHEMSDEHSGMDKKQKQWQRSTVKDILVKILAEV